MRTAQAVAARLGALEQAIDAALASASGLTPNIDAQAGSPLGRAVLRLSTARTHAAEAHHRLAAAQQRLGLGALALGVGDKGEPGLVITALEHRQCA